MHLPRSDSHRPDGAVIIMVSLAYGSGKSAYADAIAAHDRSLSAAVLVKVGHAHALGVLGSELEYVADLDAAGYFYRVLAALRADTAVNYLCKVVVFNLADIARNVETDIVVVLFVCAA